jgi:thymidine kinase
MQGYLELIIGPMFSGKSTELIRIIRRYKTIGRNILVINHKFNNRYNSTVITTHNKDSYDDCIILDNLRELITTINLNNFDIIIIEELQFFNDALENIIYLVEKLNKTVICAGLDGDSERKSFGDVLKLIPYADKVNKLSALCKYCSDGTQAHFSKRKVITDKQTLVGDTTIYEAVCRKHYNS